MSQPKNETVEKAIQAMSEIFADPRIDVWPKFKIRKNKRESEESRARSLQTYTKWAGGVAVFAYVYTHRDEIGRRVKEQVRSFQIGIVDSDTSVSILSGEVKIKKKRRFFGSVNVYDPKFDESTVHPEKVDQISNALDTHKEQEM
jgi:hypothetical protein